jgi:hypothetical protein
MLKNKCAEMAKFADNEVIMRNNVESVAVKTAKNAYKL